MRWIDSENNRIPYYTFENLSRAGFAVNAFTTKHFTDHGRHSDFLQLLKRSDSDPAQLEYCRGLLLDQFGIDREHLVPSAQKHTANIHVVTEKDIGPVDKRPVLEAVDGLVTDMPGVMLQTFGADCPSVFLADPVKRVIGLCHSGRKGTQNHIAVRMLEVMSRNFGSDPSDVLAAISPCICVDCYEVGTDVSQDFINDYLRDNKGKAVRLLFPEKGDSQPPAESSEPSSCHTEDGLSMGVLKYLNDRYHIDLTRSIVLSLKAAGVPEDNIECSDLCTKCRCDIFFSFRAEGRISNENTAILMIG